MKCTSCQVRTQKMMDSIKSVSDDFIGGILMFVGAGFYGLNVYEAAVAGNIEGVSWLWALFFVILNLAYCKIFWKANLKWSFLGSFVLFIVESIYFLQILYYS